MAGKPQKVAKKYVLAKKQKKPARDSGSDSDFEASYLDYASDDS